MIGPRVIVALAGAVLAGAAVWLLLPPAPDPTPIRVFSAPFVYGHFRVPEDNPLTEEGVQLGRMLFYDPRLSGDDTVSCATCHRQHLSFTDGKARAVGVSGRPLAFSSMSLANLLWGPQHFFWNGRANSLEEQALMPIQNPDEMNQDPGELVKELSADDTYPELFRRAYGRITPENIGKAIASFERTLISADSKYDKYLRGEVKLSSEEEKGRKLFMAHPDVKVSLRGSNCIDCHSQFLTSGFNALYDGFSNNGLEEESNLQPGLQEVTGKQSDRGKFKVPTLRNIALTAPYMHDGRFATLEEVLDHYNEGIRVSSTLSPLIVEADNLPADGVPTEISLHLSEDEKRAIIVFLHTLTDEHFITAEAFSNPFVQRSGRAR
ncbi:MAG TPA: cytochrome c peroxidase [Candidatus Polarisedimenticolia bacterium]|nr:cytochrome c peroxidase [Candidatus Polarisedimenticolia bacterium]